MSWELSTSKPRFDTLPEEVQERIVNAFMKNVVPDTSGYDDLTFDVISHWFANREVLGFWVRQKHLRTNKKLTPKQTARMK